jgi:ParB family chromosome partitioning protein
MDEIKSIPIGLIRVRRRVRSDMGDLTALMASLRKYGQMYPIIVSAENELIAGGRRLEAAKRLGWESIMARVTSQESDVERLELELEENVQRLNLTSEEIFDGFTRLDRMLNPGRIKRFLLWIRRVFRRLLGRRP